MIQILLIFSLWFGEHKGAVRGLVTTKMENCDYFLVYTNQGYALMEYRYATEEPEVGDYVYGNIHSYQSHKIWNETQEEEMSVWIEDWGLSKENALELLIEKCQ